MFVSGTLRTLLTTAVVTALVVWTPKANAQVTFSIDAQGPTVGMGIVDSFIGASITAGDILSGPLLGPPIGFPTIGPGPAPGISVPFPALGIGPSGFGFTEVDALSYGNDDFHTALPAGSAPRWFFSVDEYAIGTGFPGPTSPPLSPLPPNVSTEGAHPGFPGPAPAAAPPGAMQASADVFIDLIGAFGFGNTIVLDGDGIPSPIAIPAIPGLGLIEPNPPSPSAPDPGDNIDALDVDTLPSELGGPIYFSLDSSFFDPNEAAVAPPNFGTAAANGFVGGDVLVTITPGVTPPVVFVSAAALGLDSGGTVPDSDDLDALILFDDGDGVFEFVPDGDGLDDFLGFSVRRGSAIIGTMTTNLFPTLGLLGTLPIEEGDILIPGTFAGATPLIFLPAEVLGLATLRSAGVLNDLVTPFGDDLVAADVSINPIFAIPEPAALTMLAIGGLTILGRRRQA